MSTRSSVVCGRFEARGTLPRAGRRPLLAERVERSSSMRLRAISPLTCSSDSRRKLSTSLRFCRMTAASRLTWASSLVLSFTSCRRPAESSSTSASFLRSDSTSWSFSRSCSRMEEETWRSRLLSLVESSLISLDCRKPCLAYSLTDCSLSCTSRLSFLFSSSSTRLLFCNSSVSCTCSLSSSAMRRFSKRIFLVEASSRSTASSCDVFFISANICLYSFCSLAFSSKNLRSNDESVSLWSFSMLALACSPRCIASSSSAFLSLNSTSSRSSRSIASLCSCVA
mmetsp:Transcript_34077/g.72741  ORF Transcript_34077/g.72741 Transcript_34077/m.72741 type:complete len:283 (+) Transcript_34077:456-1304(+)